MTAKVKCGVCSGKGRLPHYAHIDSGICYACRGSGKTSGRVSKSRQGVMRSKTPEELEAERLRNEQRYNVDLQDLAEWLKGWDKARWNPYRHPDWKDWDDLDNSLEWAGRRVRQMEDYASSPERHARVIERMMHRIPKEHRKIFHDVLTTPLDESDY